MITLTVESARQIQTTEEIVLVQEATLTAENSRQIQTTEEIVLVQAATLSVEDSKQTQKTTTVTLTEISAIALSPIHPLSSGIQDELESRVLWHLPYTDYRAAISLPSQAAVVTDTQPIVERGKNYGGGVASAFSQDWYNRIHLAPNPINLGNLVSSQTREVEIWNAYFVPRDLNSVVASNADGLILTEPFPAPTTFAIFESRTYELSIGSNGPPAIDATYEFTFDILTIVLEVTGQRVVAWPIPPNWDSPVVERLEWLTEVITSKSGSEQRRKLRANPRRYLEQEVLIMPDYRALAENLLWGWQGRIYAVPLWQDQQALAAPVSKGDTVIPLTTDGYDFAAGKLVAFMNNPRNLEVLEVDTVGSESITLARPTSRAWIAGTQVFPVRLGRLNPSQELKRVTGRLSSGTLQWALQENEALAAADGSTIYRGYSVLEDMPNWAKDVTVEYQRMISEEDFPFSKDVLYQDRANVPFQVSEHTFTFLNREKIWKFRKWIHARFGKLVPVWVPNWAEDMQLVTPSASGSLTLDVRNDGYARFGKDRKGRTDIRIESSDGTILYRRITGATELDSDSERISLDSALGVAIAPGDVRIMFLSLMRLNSDTIEFSWIHGNLSDLTLALRVVQDDV